MVPILLDVGRRLQRLERQALQRIYGFDRWHVGHAGETYAIDIVRYLNARSSADQASVVEIGCGLGDILRHVHAPTRLGLDRDPGVLAAARLLARFQAGPAPRYELFDFPRTPLSGAYDTIVMVNWIHQIDGDSLRLAVHAYTAQHLRPGGRIILDTVEDPAYMYNHDVHALAPPGVAIECLGEYPRGRRVWVVR